MPDPIPPFRVAFVVGVTISKWSRIWADRHPAIPLQVLPTDQPAQTDGLHDGTADVAFVRLPVADDRLNVIPLYSEAAFVVVPKDHPIAVFDAVSLRDLEGETVLTGPAEETVALVAANVGVMVLPQSIARVHSRKDVVARPVTDGPETRIGLAWRADDASERIEDFIGIVRGRTARSSRGASAADASVVDPRESRPGRVKPSAGRPAKAGTAQNRRGKSPAKSRRPRQGR